MEVEHIIKTKHYFELTAAELAEVSNYASNEAEFDDMKSFLLSTQQTVKDQKINSTPELDDKVLNYLNQSYAQATPWYNSVLLFLFPRDKQFFKYPAFQLGIASLFVFGVFNMVNFSSFNEDKMAFENVQKFKELEEEVKNEIVEELTRNESVFDSSGTDVSEYELTIEKELEESELSNFNLSTSNGANFEKSGYYSAESELMDDVMEEVIVSDEITPLPALNNEIVDVDFYELDEDSDKLIDTKSVVITSTDNAISSPVESVSRKDMDAKYVEKSSRKKAKRDANSEMKFESLATKPVVNQISIQSTSELFELFFEVK